MLRWWPGARTVLELDADAGRLWWQIRAVSPGIRHPAPYGLGAEFLEVSSG